MNFEVIWSVRAKIEAAALLLYLKTEFGEGAVQDCMDEVERMISVLSRFPLVFPPFQGKSIRRGIVNKHLSIFYRLEEDQVELLAFWDNRRNLKKLKL